MLLAVAVGLVALASPAQAAPYGPNTPNCTGSYSPLHSQTSCDQQDENGVWWRCQNTNVNWRGFGTNNQNCWPL